MYSVALAVEEERQIYDFFSLVVETCVLQNASIHFPKKGLWLLLLFSISSVLQCVLVALIGSEILFSRDF